LPQLASVMVGMGLRMMEGSCTLRSITVVAVTSFSVRDCEHISSAAKKKNYAPYS
jgi:hypothetical protein